MAAEPKTILVAINDLFFYTKIRDVLRAGGYTLERARTTEDVLQKASGLTPAAVVVNMNDEQIDAFRLLQDLRGNARSGTVPVLAFANHEETETWRRARELGVTKIVSRNEFSSRTRELIEEISAAATTPP
ncbi:MAG TPA: histidine kinase [Nitrospirales bacterium]|nr:histidine kinase [Nitrospirales bacterium]